MENMNSYSEMVGNANFFRNANFGNLQAMAGKSVDIQKEIREKIEGSTLPFEVPVLEHTLGTLGKKALVKLGLKQEADDSITKTLVKKGLSTILEKAGLKQNADDSLAKTLAKKGLSKVLEKAGLKTPDAPTSTTSTSTTSTAPDPAAPAAPDPASTTSAPDPDPDPATATEPATQGNIDVNNIKNDDDYNAAKDNINERSQNLTDREDYLDDVKERLPYDRNTTDLTEQKVNIQSAQDTLKDAEQIPDNLNDASKITDIPENLSASVPARTPEALDMGKINSQVDVANAKENLGSRMDNLDAETQASTKQAIIDSKPNINPTSISEEAENLANAQTHIANAEAAPKTIFQDPEANIKAPIAGQNQTSNLYEDTANNLKAVTGDVVEQGAKTEGKSLAEKLALKAAMVEGEGGGPEDLLTDIGSAGLAIGAFFASIFGKHIKHPNIQGQETTLVATTGYGLSTQ